MNLLYPIIAQFPCNCALVKVLMSTQGKFINRDDTVDRDTYLACISWVILDGAMILAQQDTYVFTDLDSAAGVILLPQE